MKNTPQEIVRWARVCRNAPECSTKNHWGCPYGDESLVDCAERLEADFEELLDKIEQGVSL